MYDTMAKKTEVMELDWQRLLSALGKRTWLITLVSVLFGAAALVGTLLLVTPKFQSSVMFYVNNNSMALGDGASGITSSDISASQSLVSTYIVILDTWETMTDVINHSGVNRTYEELTKMVTAEAVADTQVFRVRVISPDAQEAWKIAQAITRVLPQRISGIIEGTSAQMVDSAQVAVKPYSPNYMKNTLIGLMLGLALTMGSILLWEIFNGTLRSPEEVESGCGFPVMAVLPEGEAGGEAARQLCDKLRFCFADESPSRVLGITGTGKGSDGAMTAKQMALALSRQGSRVLLADCDFRRPEKQPGLSDYLAAQHPLEGLLRKGEQESLYTLGAGHGSMTPAELLDSERMERLLAQLRQRFDYILLALPPAGEKEDALAAAAMADGILVVLRQKRCSRSALTAALDRLEWAGARILGIVYRRGSRRKAGKG